MNTTAIAKRRLTKELKLIEEELPESCKLKLVDNNLFHWKGYIVGPKNTPYENGKFKLEINFSKNYPMKPPSIKFNAKIFHPNIAESGLICLDILKNAWSPALQIHKILHSLLSLFDDPNPSSSLNGVAGRLYKKNREEYNNTVREYVNNMMLKFNED